MEGYEALPEDFRLRLEAALVQAKQALAVSEEIKMLAPELGPLWMDAAIMLFMDGKIGGNWNKVHAALAAAAPRLYGYVEKLIPKSDALSDVGL
jgi:hypothetical protein